MPELLFAAMLALAALWALVTFFPRRRRESENANPEAQISRRQHSESSVFNLAAFRAAREIISSGGFDEHVSDVFVCRPGDAGFVERFTVDDNTPPYVHHLVKRIYRGSDVERIELYANDSARTLLHVLDGIEYLSDQGSRGRDPTWVYRGTVTVGKWQGEVHEWHLTFYL